MIGFGTNMAFRRKRAFRKSWPRRARLARRRKTWIESQNIDPCDPVVLEHCQPLDGCCTDIVRIEIIGNQTLQDQFSDRASVVRVFGDLWFQPYMGTLTSVVDLAAWVVYLNAVQRFLGIRKGEITSQAPELPTLDIWDSAFSDLSEGRWFKTWQQFLNPQQFQDISLGNNEDSGFSLHLPVATNDTHTFVVPGTPACNSLASGTGNVCIETETDIDCFECGQSLDIGQINFSQSSAKIAPAWHVHIDFKKRIPLRENEGLYLVYNQRHYQSAGQPAAQDSFTGIYGNLRALIEMG